jgi:hypothetical protein
MIINEYRNRFYKLLESELGNVKPLICENEGFTKVDVLGDTFFHGTMGYEINSAKDLDPLFRFTDEYKEKQKNFLTRNKSASSDDGVGIYFGRFSDKIGPEDAKQYFDPNSSRSQYFDKGFMYEMTLKPNANVVTRPDYIYVSINDYKLLISQGVDAISEYPDSFKNGGGLVLLNPNAIETWKEFYRWERLYDIDNFRPNPEYSNYDFSSYKPGDSIPPEFISIDKQRFSSFDEVKKYVKEHLGVELNDPSAEEVCSDDGENCISISRPLVQNF